MRCLPSPVLRSIGVVVCFLTATARPAAAQPGLFISEYSHNSATGQRYLELFNNTGADLDVLLDAYVVQVHFNGSVAPSVTIALSGASVTGVPAGGVFVIARLPTGLPTAPNLTSSSLSFDGNDAVVLRRGGASGQIMDVIGQVGFNPGVEWGTGLVSTNNNVLRRMPTVCQGYTITNQPFNPILAAEWDGFAAGNIDNLFSHAVSCGSDCNTNGIADACDVSCVPPCGVAGCGASLDCNTDGLPDECLAAEDCNTNVTIDFCEMNLLGLDCNGTYTLDVCDIAAGMSADCDTNDVPDECEAGCNTNGTPDVCDLAGGNSLDCNTNALADECEGGCNANNTPDVCDIASGTSGDCDTNGLPDDCQTDCDQNGTPDICELAPGASRGGNDCNTNDFPDACESDGCNTNGFPDVCDIAEGRSADCDTNGVPDECDGDCNRNGTSDACDTISGASPDCNTNGVPDECESDCNTNGTLDRCDVQNGVVADCNTNIYPDICERGSFVNVTSQAFSPFRGQGGVNALYVVSGLQPPSGPVRLTFETTADFYSTAHYVDVILNGQLLGRLFDSQFVFCPFAPITDTLDVPAAQWRSLAPDARVELLMRASPTVDSFCFNAFIRANIAYATAADCNSNGSVDVCEIADGLLADCNTNEVFDGCDGPDCDTNASVDACELADGAAADCNTNVRIDACESGSAFAVTSPRFSPFHGEGGADAEFVLSSPPPSIGPVQLILRSNSDVGFFGEDVEVFLNGTSLGRVFGDVFTDCPEPPAERTLAASQTQWSAAIATGAATIRMAPAPSINSFCPNAFIEVEVRYDTAVDCDTDGTPDACEPETILFDCDTDGIRNECEIDCNTNRTADVCEFLAGGPADCNTDQVPDECQIDCDTNRTPDICDLDLHGAADCDTNRTPDRCEPGSDCNTNGRRDDCDTRLGFSPDCNFNRVPDECDLTAGLPDADSNGTLDECECSAPPAAAGPMPADHATDAATNNLVLSWAAPAPIAPPQLVRGGAAGTPGAADLTGESPRSSLDPAWRLNIPSGGWCGTQERYDAVVAARGAARVALGACPTEGDCDLPAIRNASIPGSQTPLKTYRLVMHIFCDNNGSNCVGTLAEAQAQLDLLNQDFLPWRIRFQGDIRFVNSSQFRLLDFFSEEIPMKLQYADAPDHRLNVFVLFNQSGFSIATFPWDPVALTFEGGIVLDEFHFGTSVLSHEVGHCLGLWHTHHGVSEVSACSACYESPGAGDRDVTGDFCADTDPTPVNFNCGPPGGNDFCTGNPWGTTDFHNIMGYAPTNCINEFSPQQAGRSHCWTQAVLTGWLTDFCPPTYDVLFGATNPPTTPLCTALEAPGCLTGPLLPGTTYYWQVVTRNAGNATPGPVWSFTTLYGDCNTNATPDDRDITNGISRDCQLDRVPDECGPCGDLDGDADPDGCDLAVLLAAYGRPATHPSYAACADANGDDAVDAADYATWMACYRDYINDPQAGPPTPANGGDINRDGRVDGDDIGLFVNLVISGGGGFVERMLADLNVNGAIDAGDIKGFVCLLTDPAAHCVDPCYPLVNMPPIELPGPAPAEPVNPGSGDVSGNSARK